MTEIKYDSRIAEAKKWLESSSILKDSKPYEITPISSDASFRRYFRITTSRLDRTLILMDSPPEKEPLEKFLSRAKIFEELKITIPKIYSRNAPMGFLIIEDFGDTTLLKKISETENPTTLLILAIDILLKIENEYKKKKGAFHQRVKIFSKKILLEELDLFRNWYVGTHLDRKSNFFPLQNFQTFTDLLTSSMIREPQTLIHRDFHSKNLMYLRKEKKIGVIDFQDALIGPLTYDLVSLLKDAYTDYNENVENTCLKYFFEKIKERQLIKGSFESFKTSYDYTAIQRNLKIIGIFCRLKYRDNKDSYIRYLNKLNQRTLAISENYSELQFITNFFRGISDNPLN
ncbi:phosphotransferase [Betaproteobacteria bacterium]|nr:phosphotransferase [Betaproteobacteria bacterium]